MAYQLQSMTVVSSSNIQSNGVWVYNGTASGSNEVLADIKDAGYFNQEINQESNLNPV